MATVSGRPDVEVDLTHEQLREMYELMLLARALDERMWLLNRAGQAPFAVSGQGHEGAQAGAGFALDPSKDWLAPYYRDLTLSLRFGISPRDIMLHMLARAADPNSGGRQMPGHFSSRRYHVLSASSPIATQLPHATGIAYAAKMRGEDSVTITGFGDGATSEGDFHEALNFAAIYKLGVVFLCQNNGYAISVPQSKQMAVERVSEYAQGYNMPGVTVNGLDAVEVYTVARQAVERARRGDGPTLIEALVIRKTPHSSDDDDRTYRPLAELDDLRATGPIRSTRARLLDMGALNEVWEEEARERIKNIVNEATEYAEESPLPEAHTFADHVYAAEGSRK